ncbi:PAP/OAS1 substrate-binding domain superfamily [Abeliophyllum distichum]|uniref:PAP/OAS1 substrate-binding domain superfamily n=1 Tax=Abeliophyllum distichum TaxID=126358 RepID=A0ABD1VVB4_9LAMI
MGDLLGGEASVEEMPVPSPTTSSTNSSQFDIGLQRWARAEKEAHKIICKVQPTAVSEERRREVIDYVQRLMRLSLGAELFSYGSVPLKTYLPDGDIDLTAFGGANVEDKLANDIKSVLEEEERNRAAEFVVKDVQLIRAEVKLVKCIVQNIVVDISVNQIGGLCTLCFLEQVDCLIGEDHLFKRSIILIKAWCYYESRILGAHHGLISTYALETLVLYIFHLFHSTLNGPLAVLYKFLDYFSNFDWETYCISLNGPVRLSSLPAIVAETPEECGSDLLLRDDFLRSCVEMFSVPSRRIDKNSRGFQQKYLNVVDPLKEANNLGRSVSKGNFYRIRSAFSYGARKLGRILSQPEHSIANELHKFFANTVERHGCGQRPDVQGSEPPSICNGFVPAFSDSETESFRVDDLISKSCSKLGESSQDVINGMKASGMERNRVIENGAQEGTLIVTDSTVSTNSNQPSKPNPVDLRFLGDANDLATSYIEDLKISSDSPKIHTQVLNERVSARGIPTELKDVPLAPKSSSFLEDSNHTKWDQNSKIMNGSPDSLNSLSDLTGDYDSHFNFLQYGRWCYEYASSVPPLPMPPLPFPLYQSQNPWDGVQNPQFKRNGYSHGHPNGFIPSPAVYTTHPVLIPNVAFGWEEMPKPRGTGTYFPKTNQALQSYTPSAVKGRNQMASRSPRDQMTTWSFSPGGNGHATVNGLVIQPEAGVGFGPVGHVPFGTPFLKSSRQQRPVSSFPQTPSPVSPGMQGPKPAFSMDQDRVTLKSTYHLKDEDDFPPLSV